MSWSKSATGTRESIREQVSHWPQQIADGDATQQHLTREAKQGHALQVDAAVKAVDLICETFPHVIGISGSGHAGSDGGGNVCVNYTLLKAGDNPPE